jgi:hypothetical protein
MGSLTTGDFVPYEPKPVLKPGVLYFGYNGRCFCMQHAGGNALYTGRDIGGCRVRKVTARDRAEWLNDKDIGREPQCEDCARSKA